jgi:hypothetical protein
MKLLVMQFPPISRHFMNLIHCLANMSMKIAVICFKYKCVHIVIGTLLENDHVELGRGRIRPVLC